MRATRIALFFLLSSLLFVVGACDSGGSGDDESGSSTDTSGSAKAEAEQPSSGNDELPLEATGPVAEVDGETITADEFNSLIEDQFGNSRRRIPPQVIARQKGKILDGLVSRHLIEKEVDKAEVSASDKEVEDAMSDMKERFPNDRAYQAFLRQRGMSKDDLKKKLRKDVKLRKLLKKRGKFEVTKEDAKKYYDDNPDEFKEDEKVKARHILVESKGKGDAGDGKAKKRADKLAKKAKKEGTDFAELAKKESDGPSAKKGGDLGYFARGRMVDKFSDKAFSMKDGEISGPVKTKFGYHIIKREGYKEAKKKKFKDAKKDIIDKLERKKLRGAVKELQKKLKKKAEVKKMPENIKTNASGQGGGPPGMGGMPGMKKGAIKKRGAGKKGGGALKKDLPKPEALKKGSDDESSGGE